MSVQAYKKLWFGRSTISLSCSVMNGPTYAFSYVRLFVSDNENRSVWVVMTELPPGSSVLFFTRRGCPMLLSPFLSSHLILPRSDVTLSWNDTFWLS